MSLNKNATDIWLGYAKYPKNQLIPTLRLNSKLKQICIGDVCSRICTI